jgi:hypothetical protein
MRYVSDTAIRELKKVRNAQKKLLKQKKTYGIKIPGYKLSPPTSQVDPSLPGNLAVQDTPSNLLYFYNMETGSLLKISIEELTGKFYI